MHGNVRKHHPPSHFFLSHTNFQLASVIFTSLKSQSFFFTHPSSSRQYHITLWCVRWWCSKRRRRRMLIGSVLLVGLLCGYSSLHLTPSSFTHSPLKVERTSSVSFLISTTGDKFRGKGNRRRARGSGRGGGVLCCCTLRGRRRCGGLAGLHVLDLVLLLLAGVTAAFSVWKQRKEGLRITRNRQSS